MSKKNEAADSIESGLTRLTETEYVRKLQQEADDFVFRFSIHKCRPAEARAVSSRSAEKADGEVPLADKIIDLYSRMIELAVLDDDLLRSGERRHFFPFIAIDHETKKLLVKVVPFASPEAVKTQQELRSSILLMRDFESFLNDMTVQQQAFPHIRALLKSFFVYIDGQLQRGRKQEHSLDPDFSLAVKMVEALEFKPGESLRDLYYQDTYEKFKKMMSGKGYRFDVQKEDFQQWMKAENDDPVRARISQVFVRDLETALDKKTEELKAELEAHLQILAVRSKKSKTVQTEVISAGVKDSIKRLQEGGN